MLFNKQHNLCSGQSPGADTVVGEEELGGP